MSGDSVIEELRQLIEAKREDVKWWTSQVESYTERIENNTGSELLQVGWENQLELRKQLELRVKATANAEAALQVLEPELIKSDNTGVITEAGLAAVNAEKEAVRKQAELEKTLDGAGWNAMVRGKRGSMVAGMATRKKYYRRRNKRKTKHYKKKTKRYTKKRNMRY